MSSDFLKGKTGLFKTIIIGVAIGIATVLVSMFIFAAIIYFFGIDRAFTVPLSTLSLGLGSFAAAFFVSKKIGNKGYLTGTAVGLITFAAVTVISLIVNRTGLTVNTLFHFIIIVLASAIGGIIGVNKGKGKKLI